MAGLDGKTPLGAPLDEGVPWLLFSIHGRVPRAWFWSVSVPAVFLAVFLSMQTATLPLHSPAGHLGTILTLSIATWIVAAVQVKRCHDLNQPGMMFFLSLLPYGGGIRVLAMCGFRRGTVGPSRFGADPLGGSRVDASVFDGPCPGCPPCRGGPEGGPRRPSLPRPGFRPGFGNSPGDL